MQSERLSVILRTVQKTQYKYRNKVDIWITITNEYSWLSAISITLFEADGDNTGYDFYGFHDAKELNEILGSVNEKLRKIIAATKNK